MSEDIPLNKLKISDFNVRQDVGDISELVESVKVKGVFQPILVRPEDGKYGVIIGSRRFSAAKEAKLHDIPATVKNMDDDEALTTSLAENIQRNDLEPKETAAAVGKLLETSNTRDLGKKLGKSHVWVVNMHNLGNLVTKLDKSGIKVGIMPTDQDRKSGKALPINHAIHIGNALEYSRVKEHFRKIPEKAQDSIVVDLAKGLAPLVQTDAQKCLEEFKRRPDRPVEDSIDKAMGVMSLDTFGGGGWQTGTESISADSDSMGNAINGKLIYNLKRIDEKYDFYTIGYGYSEVNEFIQRLKIKGIKTLVDVRANPRSQWTTEYNKDILERSLKKAGIAYVHTPELGVPKDRREMLETEEDYQELWKWYDKNVLSHKVNDERASASNPNERELVWSFKNAKATWGEHPIAFMCRELDPTKCHRHRIAKALEEHGKTSLDL
jgi:ParB/RepB/Spo0J family partition protein